MLTAQVTHYYQITKELYYLKYNTNFIRKELTFPKISYIVL